MDALKRLNDALSEAIHGASSGTHQAMQSQQLSMRPVTVDVVQSGFSRDNPAWIGDVDPRSNQNGLIIMGSNYYR